VTTGNFPRNLGLLASYVGSIAEVSRRLGINRQQLHRYLAGTARPSLRRMQRICDFFGVEEAEILMDHAQFREIVAIRRQGFQPVDPLGRFMVNLHSINPRANRQLEKHLGFYHTYFRPVEFPHLILRSLVSVFSRGGFTYCKTIENYSAIKRRSRRILKYTGILYHTGDRIMVHEREAQVGQMMWTTILLPSRADQVAVMSGLTLGISSGIGREIACYRVVWEFLGDQIDVRAALKAIGLYDPESPVIPRDIRMAIGNEVGEDERAFVARPWVNAPE
jgi:transcriptional regulator with XRE-family HTH domain